MARLSLRLRVFLFFLLLASGATALAAGSMALGWSRVAPTLPTAPFVTAFVAFALLNTALIVAVWLLFDEHVSKPINRLAAQLRMRAHADIHETLDASEARFLGDLGPAAAALTHKADQGVSEIAARITRETARIEADRDRLTDLLTESPIATILVNPAKEIVLYDGQAARLLAGIAPPRLRAPLSDYFKAESFAKALEGADNSETQVSLIPVGQETAQTARIRTLADDGHILYFDPVDVTSVAARPLTFDFDLMNSAPSTDMAEQPLSSLCFVVLDLETTGLSVADDDIIQIGAVRVLNGAIVEGEELSTFVNPGRPIPKSSTRIHGVTDAMVADAPTLTNAARDLHHFSRDAVLVAHNAPFDIGLLKTAEDKTGIPWEHPVLDTVLLSAAAFGTTEEHSLDALCDRLRVRIAEADRHTAIGDARATAKVLVALLKMLEPRGFTSLAALQPALDHEARRLYMD